MAQSLVKLTLESNQYEKGLRNAQRQLNDFTQSIGINMKSLSGMAIAAGAVTTAMKVMKDAFFKNEQQLDEWGRTVQSCDSLYSGFLNSLNNADISGFLTRMDDIVSAAREAYNALDDLNTYNAFNQRNEMKERAGYTKALDEYKLNPTAGNKKSLAEANKAVIDGLRETQQKTEDAYMAALRQIATERLNDKKLQAEFVKVFSEGGRNALSDAKIGYSQGKFLNAGAQYWYGDRVYDGRIQDRSTGKWRDMSQQEKHNFEFARALSQVNDSQINEVQALGRQSQAIADQIYQQDRAYNRLAGNNQTIKPTKPTKGSSGSGTVFDPQSLAGMEKVVGELTKKWRETSGVVRDGYLKDLVEAEAVLNRMKEEQYWAKEVASGKFSGKGNAYFRDSMRNATGLSSGSGLNPSGNMLLNKEAMDALAKAMEKANKQTKKEDKEETKYLSEGLSQLSGGLGGLQSGFSQLGIDLGDGFGSVVSGLQGITTILLAIQSIIGAIEAISVIDAIIPTAHGGIVRAASGTIVGTSYSGDNLRAISAGGQVYGLNAGEVVLNRAQAGNLASQLTGTGLNNLKIETYVAGRALRIVLNNESQGRMKGKYVTSQNFRG